MSYRISVFTDADDLLSKTEWCFWWRDWAILELDWVTNSTRPSRRHGWRVVSKWSRLDRRASTMERPEPPQSIKDKVRATLKRGTAVQLTRPRPHPRNR